MDAAEYEHQLQVLLGVRGPMGHLRCDGVDFLVYRLPDGGQIQNPPPDKMTGAQRKAVIEQLRKHLGLVALNRRINDENGSQ